MIRKHIVEKPQFVLTNFGLEDLIELYNVERIGYEIWRTMATMRTIGKGASFAVITQEPYYVDIRSEELSFLISFFDNKNRENDVSMNGVMFDSKPLSASTAFTY